jgi:2-C-methyl-D-erythritol 2,4-cyclodiphosphate synthase
LRIGQGFDAHRFVEGRKLILAGVEIDYPLGLAGHSDADVVCHAVVDALIGAAGLGDIGMHFPDTDPAYKDASSIMMLETISSAIYDLGMVISNIDVTILAEEPKIGKYRPMMTGELAVASGIEPHKVNVKASTTEGLGFIGRGEGIAALAVCILQDSSTVAGPKSGIF